MALSVARRAVLLGRCRMRGGMPRGPSQTRSGVARLVAPHPKGEPAGGRRWWIPDHPLQALHQAIPHVLPEL
eukprot:11196762-Lingulodinium_polyedra.AAC.1